MSALEEKLNQGVPTEGNAKATLGQLIKRWGSPNELDGKSAPEMILVRRLDGWREYWRPVSHGKPATATMYELRELLPPKESK